MPSHSSDSGRSDSSLSDRERYRRSYHSTSKKKSHSSRNRDYDYESRHKSKKSKQHSSKSSRSRSRSHSRRHRKHRSRSDSSSPRSSSSRSKTQSLKSEIEATRSKMRAQLDNAQAVLDSIPDDVLKPTSSFSSDLPTSSVPRIDAIAEIEAEGFKPQAYESHRGSRYEEMKAKDKKPDMHELAMFEQSSETTIAPIKAKNDSLFNPALFEDPDLRWQRWVVKLQELWKQNALAVN